MAADYLEYKKETTSVTGFDEISKLERQNYFWLGHQPGLTGPVW